MGENRSCDQAIDYYRTFAIKRDKPIIALHRGKFGDFDWLVCSFTRNLFANATNHWLENVLDIQINELKYVRFKETTDELNRVKVKELLETIDATRSEAPTIPSQQKRKPGKQQTAARHPNNEIDYF